MHNYILKHKVHFQKIYFIVFSIYFSLPYFIMCPGNSFLMVLGMYMEKVIAPRALF